MKNIAVFVGLEPLPKLSIYTWTRDTPVVFYKATLHALCITQDLAKILADAYWLWNGHICLLDNAPYFLVQSYIAQ